MRLGYPVASHLPNEFILSGVVINEPNKDDPGEIVYWVIEKGKEPRAISLPYTKNRHEQANRMREAMKKLPQGSNGLPVRKKGAETSSREGKGDGKQGSGGIDEDNTETLDYGFKTFPMPEK